MGDEPESPPKTLRTEMRASFDAPNLEGSDGVFEDIQTQLINEKAASEDIQDVADIEDPSQADPTPPETASSQLTRRRRHRDNGRDPANVIAQPRARRQTEKEKELQQSSKKKSEG